MIVFEGIICRGEKSDILVPADQCNVDDGLPLRNQLIGRGSVQPVWRVLRLQVSTTVRAQQQASKRDVISELPTILKVECDKRVYEDLNSSRVACQKPIARYYGRRSFTTCAVSSFFVGWISVGE